MKLTKNRYLKCFIVAVLLLAVVRLQFPQVVAGRDAHKRLVDEAATVTPALDRLPMPGTGRVPRVAPPLQRAVAPPMQAVVRPHPIRSVPSYAEAFPDTNAVQLAAARQWGVKPVRDRDDAENRKKELVYIGSSPYYSIDPLRQSIPYLVPRAAVLLQDIGQTFFDSLYVKGVPLHRLIVTSVLRSQADVERLRQFNGNATENSCHLYGTTFDICYNRYKTVEDPDGPPRREVRNDTLKYVLSEVLNDMRQQQRCYVKYEVKQGCFHITVR